MDAEGFKINISLDMIWNFGITVGIAKKLVGTGNIQRFVTEALVENKCY